MTHLPERLTTKAEASNALDRIDRLLERIDDASARLRHLVDHDELPPPDC